MGYRNLARPAISLWEHRAATARLREQGRREVDEAALFATVEAMRQLSDTATRTTRRTRRARARRPAGTTATTGTTAARVPAPPDQPPDTSPGAVAAAPFTDIEVW